MEILRGNRDDDKRHKHALVCGCHASFVTGCLRNYGQRGLLQCERQGWSSDEENVTQRGGRATLTLVGHWRIDVWHCLPACPWALCLFLVTNLPSLAAVVAFTPNHLIPIPPKLNVKVDPSMIASATVFSLFLFPLCYQNVSLQTFMAKSWKKILQFPPLGTLQI